MLLAGRLRDEHVRGLDVTMDEALLVCCVQGLGNLLEDVDRALRIKCAFVGHELREVGAVHIAHREEQHAVVVTCVEDRDDVGWSSEAAIRDSRRKRSRKRASSASSEAITLSATFRPSSISSAR